MVIQPIVVINPYYLKASFSWRFILISKMAAFHHSSGFRLLFIFWNAIYDSHN